MKIRVFDYLMIIILQVILVFCKIEGTISLSWGLVFIPTYIYVCSYLFIVILAAVAIKKREKQLNDIHKKFFGFGIDEDDFNDDIF